MKVEKKGFQMLPSRPGTCSVCARKHAAHLAHDLTSLFYATHFQLRYKCAPTWADATGHLTKAERASWKQAMRDAGIEWTSPLNREPIAEPYARNDPSPSSP